MSTTVSGEHAAQRLTCPHGGAQVDRNFYDCAHACASADGRMVIVWNAETDESLVVTREQAAAGIAAYARSLGPGTPACGVWERKALEMLRGGK